MSFILVTNDDGADSPALLPLARALAKLGPIRVVVPETERSWIGKAITRWSDVTTRSVEAEGVEMVRVSGSPADCANLGVHTLFEERPEMVVSGVNIGLNTGSGFFLSSGTVGAAIEGWIAGLPALAFSVGNPGDDKNWKSQAGSQTWREIWERAAAISADVVGTVRRNGFPDGVDLLNVNFSVEATMETPRVVTRLATVGYDQLFVAKGEGVYGHDYSGAIPNNAVLEGSDVEAVRAGRVSITPVQLLASPRLDGHLRRALERTSG